MASQTRTYSQKKLLGQVYTPLHIVEKILLHTGFYAADLQGKQILDPACGDGRFLVPIVTFIIENTPKNDLEAALKQVHGWDIDQEAITACRSNLDALIRPLNIAVDWNLKKCDALKQRNRRGKFDFIVGNPPYIRIQHLSQSQRKYVQDNYSFCKNGSTDAFVAFFELAAALLTESGVCGFITPNSYLKSETSRQLRAYFSEYHNLLNVTDYGAIPVFGNTGTYPAITVFGKKKNPSFRFQQCLNTDFQYAERQIDFTELPESGKPWQLSIRKTEEKNGQRLGDICKISVGITTLADRYYLFTIISEQESMVYAKNKAGMVTYLEKAILKPIVKGSKLKGADDPVTEFILFPYRKDNLGKHRIIPEEDLKLHFPETFSYLFKVKPELDRRDNGKPNPVAWYAYGRSQSLDSSFGKKIIFSPMNLAPNFVLYEHAEATVYSGYFIKYEGDYQNLLRQLNSQRMADFMAVAGRDFQGGYKGYNKKAVENFIITDE